MFRCLGKQLRTNGLHPSKCLFYERAWLTIATISTDSAINYCADLVRVNDFENYLCTLQLPKHARTAGFAVRAFNVEVAKVMDNVHEGKLAEMRFHFWKDVINEIYNIGDIQAGFSKVMRPFGFGKSRLHPVVLLLAQVIHSSNLNKIWFSRLISAREKYLGDQPFLNLTDIEEYGENSVSPVFYLILESLGIKNMNADHVVSHIGRAVSLSTVLRAVPYYAQKRKVLLPIDLMDKNKVSQEDIIRQRNELQISNIVYDIACQAQAHLEKARSMRLKLSNEALRVCLPAVSCSLYLQRLENVNFDVFHSSLQKRVWLLPMHLLTSSISNKF